MIGLNATDIKVIINGLDITNKLVYNAYKFRKYCEVQGLMRNNLEDIYSCTGCNYKKICNKYLRLK